MAEIVDEQHEPIALSTQSAFTQRSVVAFENDVKPEQMKQAIAGLNRGSLVERSLIFADLGVAVIPLSVDYLHYAFDGGRGGVAAVDRERISFVAPYRRYPTTSSKSRSAIEVLGISGATAAATGVRVAILDSGFRNNHPDFKNRVILRKRFVANTADADQLGHGTHCTGIACGPATPTKGDRYGVAPGTEILAGKVASWYGTVLDASIFAGFCWARQNNARVINLSLGGPVPPGVKHSAPFEEVAKKMLHQYRILVIAGAGNDPPTSEDPVHHPANCPSVVAVAALGPNHEGASKESAVHVNADGEVNVAAPGMGIRSSDIFGDYSTRSGTSMAAAFATGVAAVWAATGLSGPDLRDALFGSTVAVAGATAAQVGRGLIQVP